MPHTVNDGSSVNSVTSLPATRGGAVYQRLGSQLDDPACPADPRYEADWAQEMAADGCTDLPVSWYRQTPWNALRRPHGLVSIGLVFMVSFGMNVLFGYVMSSGADEVGLWRVPKGASHPYSSTALKELLSIVLAISLLDGCTARFMGLRALKKGWTVMVAPELMSGGLWRLVPFGLRPSLRRGFLSGILRGLLFSLLAFTFSLLPFFLLLEIICTSGGMHGHNSTCSMEKVTYVWVKTAYITVTMTLLRPLVLLMGISASVLTEADRAAVIESQRQRWQERELAKVASISPL